MNLQKITIPQIKVRRGQSELVRSTRVHDKDPRKKTRAQQKKEWKKSIKDY